MYEGKRVSVVIPAAGSGKRMNSGNVNKVYIELLGKTVLERTFEVFEKNEYVDRIIVAARADEVEFCRENILNKDRHPKLMDVIPGGAERCNSVLNALDCIDDEDIVLIHDGARPLIEDELVCDSIKAVYEHGCCAAGVPVKDTIKIASGDFFVETPDRSTLYAIHTPQGFICGEIKADMRKCLAEGFLGTDEAVFAEKQGKKVFIVKSKYDNIKVTTSDDLIVAEAVLNKRNRE